MHQSVMNQEMVLTNHTHALFSHNICITTGGVKLEQPPSPTLKRPRSPQPTPISYPRPIQMGVKSHTPAFSPQTGQKGVKPHSSPHLPTGTNIQETHATKATMPTGHTSSNANTTNIPHGTKTIPVYSPVKPVRPVLPTTLPNLSPRPARVGGPETEGDFKRAGKYTVFIPILSAFTHITSIPNCLHIKSIG